MFFKINLKHFNQMKKHFQILTIAGTMIFFSCGEHNTEVAGTIPTGIKELSTNSSSLSNETDLFLIDTDGQLRFNADPADQAIELPYRPSARSASYTINRRGVTKTIIQLNESFVVN